MSECCGDCKCKKVVKVGKVSKVEKVNICERINRISNVRVLHNGLESLNSGWDYLGVKGDNKVEDVKSIGAGKIPRMFFNREVIAWNPPLGKVREWIMGAGNKIGSVHFIKRSNGEMRKISYRLHVKNPSVASIPKGLSGEDSVSDVKVGNGKKSRKSRKLVDLNNDQMTVFDVNHVVYDSGGNYVGRGGWRTISLEGVTRIVNSGVTYVINRKY
jgi:hypothetical protein